MAVVSLRGFPRQLWSVFRGWREPSQQNGALHASTALARDPWAVLGAIAEAGLDGVSQPGDGQRPGGVAGAGESRRNGAILGVHRMKVKSNKLGNLSDVRNGLFCWLVMVAFTQPGVTASAAAQDVRQLARAVDDHYNHLRSLQVGLHRDLPGRGPGAGGIGHLVVEKAAQDAVGIPFSEREAVCQRRPGGVVLPAGGTATQKDDTPEAGRPAVTTGILAR